MPSDAQIEAQKTYLVAKLADVRKSCEYVATFAAATVLGNAIKNDIGNTFYRRVMFVACGVSIVLSLFGAMSIFQEEKTLAILIRTLKVRSWIRNIGLAALLVALITMVADSWTPRSLANCVPVPCYVPGAATVTPTLTVTPTPMQVPTSPPPKP